MADAAHVAWQQRRAAFGPPRPWLRLVALLVALFLLLPSAVVVAMSFSAGKLLTFPPQGFSLEWYGNFFRSKAWSGSTVNSLQVALLVTLLASLVGVVNAFRMMRLPEPAPSTAVDGMVLG